MISPVLKQQNHVLHMHVHIRCQPQEWSPSWTRSPVVEDLAQPVIKALA